MGRRLLFSTRADGTPRLDGKVRCKFCKKYGSPSAMTVGGNSHNTYHRACNAAYQRERRRRLKDA